MMIVFSGLDRPVCVKTKCVTIMQVASQSLFARIVSSLFSEEGELACEPYTLWEDDEREIRATEAFISVANPLDLPWKHKLLTGALHKRIEECLSLDEDLRFKVQQLNAELMSCVACVGFQFNADYEFKVEWRLRHYLKAFDYSLAVPESNTLLDNLILFVDLVADMCANRTLLFVNLKTFLSRKDLSELYSRVLFHGIPTLLIENQKSEVYDDFEQKIVIDQHFVEYVIEKSSECPSSTQRRICSNGFGAVTF